MNATEIETAFLRGRSLTLLGLAARSEALANMTSLTEASRKLHRADAVSYRASASLMLRRCPARCALPISREEV